jgi:TM2 domain-containing membrane protein YozV
VTNRSPSQPGWYDDPEGRRRWWDGERWGAYAPWGGGAAIERPSPAQPRPRVDPRYLHDPTPSRPAPQVVHHVMHAPAKELAVAYLLLFFFGTFGAHRFYLGRNGSAIAMLCLALLGGLTAIFFVGFLLLSALVVWWLVDIFITPGMVREENHRAALQAQSSVGYYRGWPAA